MALNQLIQDAYSDILKKVVLLDTGIKNMEKLVAFPSDTIPDDMKQVFAALCEFVSFRQGIMEPFFILLDSSLSGRVTNLYEHLKSVPDCGYMLSYTEAFCLLNSRVIKHKIQILLEHDLPSNILNGVMDAIENEDLNKFKEVLSGGDYSKIMSLLWMLRYVLFGITKVGWEEKWLRNYWLVSSDLNFFCDYGSKFMKIHIKKYLNINDNRKYRISGLSGELNEADCQYLDNIVGIADGHYYAKWQNELCSKCMPAMKNVLSDTALQEICKELVDEVLSCSVCSYPEKICELYHIQYENKNVEESSDSQNDCFSKVLEKDIVAAREHNYETELLNDLDFYFREFILLYSNRMGGVYDIVKGVLSDTEKTVFEWLLGLSKYTDKIVEPIVRTEINIPDDFFENVNYQDEIGEHFEFNEKLDKPHSNNEKAFPLTCKLQKFINMIGDAGYIDNTVECKELFLYILTGRKIGTWEYRRTLWNDDPLILFNIIKNMTRQCKGKYDKMFKSFDFPGKFENNAKDLLSLKSKLPSKADEAGKVSKYRSIVQNTFKWQFKND